MKTSSITLIPLAVLAFAWPAMAQTPAETILPAIIPSGQTNVKEGYIELLIPTLADLPLAKKVELDAAYRRSSYNLAGGVNAYKGDFTWTVVDPVRFRGGYERAVRAPSLR